MLRFDSAGSQALAPSESGSRSAAHFVLHPVDGGLFFRVTGLFAACYNPAVQVRVHFYSYFKDLTGSTEVTESLAPCSKLEDLLQKLYLHFPKLATMKKSALVAVGVDYQGGDYVLTEGDEVSLFPPVQGG
jgi:molybdopterin converting factor small subunit